MAKSPDKDDDLKKNVELEEVEIDATEDEDDADISADDEDDGDEGSHEGGDDTDEAKKAREDERRERRRKERKSRKERLKEHQERERRENSQLKRELDEMRQKVASVESWRSQNDAQRLDQALNSWNTQYQQAVDAEAQAISRSDGEAARRAKYAAEQARSEYWKLRGIKERMQPAQQVQQQPQLSRRAQSHAQEFMDDHKWFSHAGSDVDSKIVLAIDAALAEEGYEPETEEYWDELRDRIEDRMPHKFKKKRRTGPPVGGSRSASENTKKVFIDKDTVEAWKKAGYWDDPEKRKRMTKRYLEQQKNAR
jgi:hypothetical protein